MEEMLRHRAAAVHRPSGRPLPLVPRALVLAALQPGDIQRAVLAVMASRPFTGDCRGGLARLDASAAYAARATGARRRGTSPASVELCGADVVMA